LHCRAYTLTDSRLLPRPEAWRYGAAPGFEFLSQLSDRTTARLAGDFLRLHRAVDAVWPLAREAAAAPAVLIFCEDQRRFARFAPPDAPRDLSGTVSLSYQNHEQAVLILNQAAAEASAAPAEPDLGAFNAELLRVEYRHFLFSRIAPPPPAWLAAGLGRLFQNLDTDASPWRLAGTGDPADASARLAFAAKVQAAGPHPPWTALAGDPRFRAARLCAADGQRTAAAALADLGARLAGTLGSGSVSPASRPRGRNRRPRRPNR